MIADITASQKLKKIQTKMTTSPKKVVILGLGYSGAAVAKFLEKFPKEVELTIVSPREFLLHKISASSCNNQNIVAQSLSVA